MVDDPRATRPGPLPPGTRLAGYTVLRRLGQGGMGTVYAARQDATGAERALKVLGERGDPELEQRFLREAEAMGRVDRHQNVVRVFEGGRAQGHLYLAMELVEGEDLEQRLRRDGPLPPDAAAALVEALCGALAHVHAAGVLHRDLKPANVLLEAGGTPRVTDFGLARLTGAESLTRTGTFLGSPSTMAPEQADGSGCDERTDVYGLGAILYAALTGQPPFAGEGLGLVALLSRVLHQPPRPPSQVQPGIPAALEAICLRCLLKAPGARYPSARTLADELRRWQAGQLRAPFPTRPALLSAAALVVSAGVGWGLLGGRSPDGRIGVAAVATRPSEPIDDQIDQQGAAARARYLELCDQALAGPSEQLERELQGCLAGLSPAALELLRADKRRQLSAPAVWLPELCRRLERPGPRADDALRAVSVVCGTRPELEAPGWLVEPLQAALLALARGLRPDSARDAQQLTAFALAQARALGWPRPLPELRTWIQDAVRARGSDYPLPLVRIVLYLDDQGISKSMSPLVIGVGERSLDELRAALAEVPDSQALALLLLERFSQATDKPDEDARWWPIALDAGRLASGPGPGDLGPEWHLRAGARLVKLLHRRGSRTALPETPEQRAARRTELQERFARLRAEAWALHDGGHVLAESSWQELRESTHLCGGDLVAAGRSAEALEAYQALLTRLRVAGQVSPKVLCEALRNASGIYADAGDLRGADLADEARRLAQTSGEERDALTAQLDCLLRLPAHRERLAQLDQRDLSDLRRVETLMRIPGDGRTFAALAVRSARLRGDREAARARAALGAQVDATWREELFSYLPVAWR